MCSDNREEVKLEDGAVERQLRGCVKYVSVQQVTGIIDELMSVINL